MPDDLLARARAYAASIADKSGKYTAAIYLAQLVTRCERAEAEIERLRPLAEAAGFVRGELSIFLRDGELEDLWDYMRVWHDRLSEAQEVERDS